MVDSLSAGRRDSVLTTQTHDSAKQALATSSSEPTSIVPLLTMWWLALALLRFMAGMFVTSPSIFGDELEYWSMARSFHHNLQFLAFNGPYDISTQIYPILLSPLFSVHDSVVIYPLVKLLSSLMLCSAIFPVYFMARELLNREESLGVALLSLLIPGGAYTATVMAENPYYPIFVLMAWLCYRTLVRGTVKDSLLAGVTIAVGYFVKPHILFLVMGYGLTLVTWFIVRSFEAPTVKHGVKRLLPELFVRCVPFAFLLVDFAIRWWETAGAASLPLSVILFGGAYQGAIQLGTHSVPLRAFLESGWWLFVVITMSTAWLPMFAMVGIPALWKRINDSQRWFWVLSCFTMLVFLVMITRHNVLNDGVLRTHERYVFQLSPLLLIWFLSVRKLLPVRSLFIAAGTFVVAISVMFAESSHVLTWSAFTDSPTFSNMFRLRMLHPASNTEMLAFLLGGGALCLLAAMALRRPRTLLAGWAIFLIVCNIGWYDLEYTAIKQEVRRFNDLAMYLKSTLPLNSSAGLLQDQADVRAAWYPNFWLMQPYYYYGLQERPYWFDTPISRAPDGSLNFGNQRPQFLLASDSIALPYAPVHDFGELHLRLYEIPALTGTTSSK